MRGCGPATMLERSCVLPSWMQRFATPLGKAGSMSAADLEQRIRRVMSDLREETTIPGQVGSPCSLQHRMAQTCTPAAGVGVIDEFEVAWARGFGTLAAG